jgi:ABC-type dipeptide/oligopeptide/nickel transport system permease subunit
MVTFILIGSSSYVALKYGGIGSQAETPLWSIMIANISNGVQHLALSPLCFFGAYMLEKSSGS